MAYAWFWGAAGSEVLGAITTVPTNVITATATGTQAASLTAADKSVNGLIFDGFLTQALKSGSGAYWKRPGRRALTADGDGGVVEIERRSEGPLGQLPPEPGHHLGLQPGGEELTDRPGGQGQRRCCASTSM
jgi:hypothetical protein